MTSVECPYCNKVFRGINKIQIESQLLFHKVSKHKDKIKIIENGQSNN